jgi:hypothetical protein
MVLACAAAACGPAVNTVPGPVAPRWEPRRWVSVGDTTVLQVALRSTLDDLEDFSAPQRRVERDAPDQELQFITVERVEFRRSEVVTTGIEPRADPFNGPHVHAGRDLGAVRFAAQKSRAGWVALVAFPPAYDRADARPRPGVRRVALQRFLALVRARAGKPPAGMRLLLDPKRYANIVHCWIVATDEKNRPLACAERGCLAMDIWFGGHGRVVESHVALALEPGARLPSYARPAPPPPPPAPAAPAPPATQPASGPADLPPLPPLPPPPE